MVDYWIGILSRVLIDFNLSFACLQRCNRRRFCLENIGITTTVEKQIDAFAQICADIKI